MANSNREVEGHFSLAQGVSDLSPIKPMTSLQRLLAHQYDLRPREKVFLGDENGGIRRVSIRPATQEEISIGMNGGEHKPIDVSLPKKIRLSHGDYVRASREGRPSPDTFIPFGADYEAARNERAARKASAKALKNKGNKG